MKEFFFGTKEWFTGFRKRTGLHTAMRHGEAANGDWDAAEQHHEKFKKIIEEEGFVSQQCLPAMKRAFSGRECHAEHEGGDHLARP